MADDIRNSISETEKIAPPDVALEPDFPETRSNEFWRHGDESELFRKLPPARFPRLPRSTGEDSDAPHQALQMPPATRHAF